MTPRWTGLALAIPSAWVLSAGFLSPSAAAQEATGDKPQVEIVQTHGCVETRGDTGATWWLTNATEPKVTKVGVFNAVQVGEAKEAELGSRDYQLVGVADFLDAESLLAWGDRAEFTTRDQANATGELRAGRTVLVKGLLIESDTVARINLLSVVGLAESCDG